MIFKMDIVVFLNTGPKIEEYSGHAKFEYCGQQSLYEYKLWWPDFNRGKLVKNEREF